jgi:hypothetical protein
MRDTTELIEDLQAGYDPTPEDHVRELERLSALAEEAAERIMTYKSLIETMTAAMQLLNDDPFRVLSRIDVGEHIEKKNGLNYLSWAWAWDTIMRYYPDTQTDIKRPESGLPYWTDGRTCWVDVSVTVAWNDRTRTRSEVFPIMDHRNKSIPLENVTSFDINTALQRAWTKCIARHGLGFYIYAGQDLPNEVIEEQKGEIDVEEEMLARVNVLQEVSKDLAERLGREPKLEELAEFMKMTEDEVREIMKVTMDALSLSEANRALQS